MEENEIMFTIIVPVYNVEKYIKECIDSILEQSFKEFELILIDDGSPDLCGEICDKYAKKDNRVKVIHKENEGLLSAWKTGLKNAKGKYIGSVDSDDFIDRGLLEEINKKIVVFDCDIVVYGYKSVSDDGKKKIYPILVKEGIYDRNKAKTEILPGLINRGCFEKRSNIYLSRINKFIKRTLLTENESFYECNIEYGEDNLWTIPNIISADGIYVMSKYYPYNYRYNPTSITHSVNKNLWYEFKKLDKYIIDILFQLGRNDMVEQVYRDSVFHAAVSINNIVMDTASLIEKVAQIKKIVSDDYVKRGLSAMCKNRCSSKERFNMFLMRHKFSYFIYIIKIIQKNIQRFIC